MVKRYSPRVKEIPAEYYWEETEYKPKMEKSSEGDYVTYEAYRLLEDKFNTTVYGKTATSVAKYLGVRCERLVEAVDNYNDIPEWLISGQNFEASERTINKILNRE